MDSALPCFHDLSPAAWRAAARELGFGPVQAQRLFRAVQNQWPATWAELDAPDRQVALAAEAYSLAPLPEISARTEATDGTMKFLLNLPGGGAVEAVHIPEESRGTVCLSSQVGCAMGCTFCFTGKMGLIRNLKPHEITGQWMRLRKELPHRAFTNIVFMGMGEPLHNLENVLTALEIFTSDYGLAVPARRITVSTSGLLPGIKAMFARTSVRLAISVNGPTPEKRLRVMPVEKGYSIHEILDFLRTVKRGIHHSAMFEYVLLGGENDSDADAADLLAMLGDVPGRINLIPFNAHPGSEFRRPDDERVLRFHALLRKSGRHVFIRHSRGRDVLAACGQLHHTLQARTNAQ